MKNIVFLLLLVAAASQTQAADCTPGVVTITPPVLVPAVVTAPASQAECDRAALELRDSLSAAQARLFDLQRNAGVNAEAALVRAISDTRSATQAVRTSDGRILLTR